MHVLLRVFASKNYTTLLAEKRAAHSPKKASIAMALAAAETASQDGECDTASDIPEESLNPLFLSEYLFNQLQHYHGVIITGNASQLFESDADWGKSMRLSDSEALQFRVYPKGLLSSGTLLEAKKTVIMVASRRRSGVEKDSVTFAILWHPEVEQQRRHTITPFEELVTSTQTVSARCLHILLPSLFNHHDATHASATKAGTPHVSPYPVLDEKFFHAVRPSSFTVHRAVQVSDQTMLALTAAPGLSQFVVAGHLAGLQTDDPPHRACEPCAFSKWNEMTTNYAKGVVEKVGTAKGVSAMLSAVNTCDLLTCEGLLSVLSHSFVGGAMPDSLHSPNGVPLLIAFCTRLACYPERFGLAGGTNADQMACKEVVSMFESSWEPICPVQAGTRNVYSIDLVIKSAYTEARQAARKESTTQAVEDNLLFWQRAGQRCITALFSCQVEDFVVPRCAFGHCARLQDPLDAARAAVVQKQFSPFDAVTGGAGAVSTALCSLQHRKTMLLTVLSSVEQWLRTGSYCSMQLHKKNDPKPSTRTMMSKNELTSAVNSGIEASVKELMDSGEYEDEVCAADSTRGRPPLLHTYAPRRFHTGMRSRGGADARRRYPGRLWVHCGRRADRPRRHGLQGRHAGAPLEQRQQKNVHGAEAH